MDFTLDGIGKRYDSHWIIRHLDFTFLPDKIYGVAGANGSGKSTLLRMLSTMVTPTEGKLLWKSQGGEAVELDDIPTQLSYAAPYITPPLEFTLQEMVDYHASFRPLRDDMSSAALLDTCLLADHRGKRLRQLSSGMLQRFLLGLALYTDSRLVLLDEPTSNLDTRYRAWFYEHLESSPPSRITVLASNDDADLAQCSEILSMSSYQHRK